MPNNRLQPGITKKAPSKQHPNGGWQVRYRDPDNATRRRTFDTKQQALDFQAGVRTAKRTGDWIDDKLARTPFKDVAERWFEGTLDLQPTTRAAYRSMLKTYILPGLGHYPVGKINAGVLRKFIADLPEELSDTRKRHVFRTLVPIFNLAVDDGMIRTSPTAAKSVKQRVPRPQQKKMLFLDAGQVDALASAITPRYRPLVYCAAYTGMRAGELVALKVKHLDLKRGRVTVEESVSDVNGHLTPGPTKNKKTRGFGIPPFLGAMLKEHLGDRQADPDAFVFGENGRPMRHGNVYGRHFKPAVRAALPEDLHGLRFHDLRHTCASILLANGEHPKAVQERLGHSSIAITLDRYSHFYREHEDALVGRLEETYQAAVGTAPAPAATVTALPQAAT